MNNVGGSDEKDVRQLVDTPDEVFRSQLELNLTSAFQGAKAAAAHMAASTPNAKWPAGASDMLDSILTEPVLPTGQVMEPPPGSGLGVELDHDKLAYYDAQWA